MFCFHVAENESQAALGDRHLMHSQTLLFYLHSLTVVMKDASLEILHETIIFKHVLRTLVFHKALYIIILSAKIL